MVNVLPAWGHGYAGGSGPQWTAGSGNLCYGPAMDRAWFVARLAEIEQQIAESEGRIERLNGRLDDVRQRGTPLDVALARELLLTLKDSHALLLDHRDRLIRFISELE